MVLILSSVGHLCVCIAYSNMLGVNSLALAWSFKQIMNFEVDYKEVVVSLDVRGNLRKYSPDFLNSFTNEKLCTLSPTNIRVISNVTVWSFFDNRSFTSQTVGKIKIINSEKKNVSKKSNSIALCAITQKYAYLLRNVAKFSTGRASSTANSCVATAHPVLGPSHSSAWSSLSCTNRMLWGRKRWISVILFTFYFKYIYIFNFW